ncbi:MULTISPECIES: hypothetical protein [Aquimarina]|uniref:hypothetical protein n=1 Tax=Aquimarina TaxID=290174 RepID=UPI00047139DD|nr:MULTISPECIES: hypothetical protein [Aquimarina]
MKKLFLLLFVLGAGLSTQAQVTWEEMSKIYDEELYPLAKDVSEMTDKVIANGNVVSIVKDTGTTSVQKIQDKSVPVKYFDYYLLTANGRKIGPLEAMQAHKVVHKFLDVLKRVKENASQDNTKEIENILNSL